MQPLEKITQDDNTPMEKLKAFCIYHQWKGHATNLCKALEVAMLDLIAQGKHEIDKKDSDSIMIINVILVDKEVCDGLQKGCPRYVPNSITIK